MYVFRFFYKRFFCAFSSKGRLPVTWLRGFSSLTVQWDVSEGQGPLLCCEL